MNDFIASLMLLGAVGTSGGYLPYWCTTNQYSLMPERSGALSVLQARTSFRNDGSAFDWCYGTSFAANTYANPYSEKSVNFIVDELYACARVWKLNLELGQKHCPLEYYGADSSLGSLSVTSGHIAESGNARSMPGYLLTLEPVAVPFTAKRLCFYGGWGDYKTTDNRYVRGALVHRMKFGFTFRIAPGLFFDGYLDHYAMWAGDNPDPDQVDYQVTWENYFRVATARKAGSSGAAIDRQNVIGDQGGGECLKLSYRQDGWTLCFQHDRPYSDASSMGFRNFPDGVNTLSISLEDKDRWVSDLLYEYHYTMYQSGSINLEQYDENVYGPAPEGSSNYGLDNYFSNLYYRSGWTHYGHLIGDPLCLPKGIHDGSWSSSLTNMDIENNRYKAHHFALSGKLFRKCPYKAMLTYSNNYGNYYAPYKGESQIHRKWGSVKETGIRQFSFGFTGIVNDFFGLDCLSGIYGLFADFGELYEDSVGLQLGLKYSL